MLDDIDSSSEEEVEAPPAPAAPAQLPEGGTEGKTVPATVSAAAARARAQAAATRAKREAESRESVLAADRERAAPRAGHLRHVVPVEQAQAGSGAGETLALAAPGERVRPLRGARVRPAVRRKVLALRGACHCHPAQWMRPLWREEHASVRKARARDAGGGGWRASGGLVESTAVRFPQNLPQVELSGAEFAPRERVRDEWMIYEGEACPVAALAECGDVKCPLSRIRRGQQRQEVGGGGGLREHFERLAVEAIALAAEGCHRPLHIASVGCGLLFFEFWLLEALRARGVRVARFTAVDDVYNVRSTREDVDPTMGPPEGKEVKRALEQFATWFGDELDVRTYYDCMKFSRDLELEVQRMGVDAVEMNAPDVLLCCDAGDGAREAEIHLLPCLAGNGLYVALSALSDKARMQKGLDSYVERCISQKVGGPATSAHLKRLLYDDGARDLSAEDVARLGVVPLGRSRLNGRAGRR